MNSNAVKLRAEFKPLLSTLSVSLELAKNLICKSVQIIIEPSTLTVRNRCYSYSFELEGLSLLPASCRNLRWAGLRELQMTLQVTEQSATVDSNGLIFHQTSPINQDFLVSRIQSSQNHCHCVGCGVRIFKSQSRFKRVLPLPSENWSDFADIWFCHNHSHNASESQQDRMSCSGDGPPPEPVSKLKSFPVLPRVDDCLVSSLYMLLDSRHVKPGSVTQTAGRLICKRCGNFIGFIKDERKEESGEPALVYKIYHHAVSFKVDESSNDQIHAMTPDQGPAIFSCNNTQQHVEDFMSCLLKDQSRMFTSFRFILTSSLQAKDQSCISVLLWLLDQELSVFSSQVPSSSHPEKECVKLSSRKYMKLLYKAKFSTLGEYSKSASITNTSNIFEAWRIDNTVHGISLPYPLCKQLIQLLVTSTKTLTKSQRCLNGFHVGYLKLS